MASRNGTGNADHPDWETFLLDGIELQVPKASLNMPLRKALQSGRFESAEARALSRHIQADDRVLELGAGTGYLAIQAARVIGPENVMAVEANPNMIEPIRANLHRNGCDKVDLRHGAVVADASGGDQVPFYARKAFWAASLDQPAETDHDTAVSVRALSLGTLLAAHRPTLVVMDVEGAEIDLAAHEWPLQVRLIIMEIHRKKYGAHGIAQVFAAMAKQGLAYMPWGTKAETVVFERLT